MPFDQGQVIFLGWDWFNALPTPGFQDGGWLTVLDNAIHQALGSFPPLAVTKMVDDTQPRFGETINYTIVMENLGPSTTTSGFISDTIPAGLTLASISLNPALSGTLGVPPLLATDLNISSGDSVTLTVQATVNTFDTVIVNTAEVSATNAPVGSFDQVAVTVPPSICLALGMDGFGYTCRDSNDYGGPIFAFEDIVGAGGSTALSAFGSGRLWLHLPGLH